MTMPLSRQFELGEAVVSVWKITETLEELMTLVSDECVGECRSRFTSEKRAKEWLAVRALVRLLFGDDMRVMYDVSGKPALDNSSLCISISHTDGYAVLAFSAEYDVGVDVELFSRNVVVAARRFMPCEILEGLSPEQANHAALIHWCAKEALFKITGDLGGNFSDNISVAPSCLSMNGTLSLEIVGIDNCSCKLFVGEYVVDGGLLFVVCRNTK